MLLLLLLLLLLLILLPHANLEEEEEEEEDDDGIGGWISLLEDLFLLFFHSLLGIHLFSLFPLFPRSLYLGDEQ